MLASFSLGGINDQAQEPGGRIFQSTSVMARYLLHLYARKDVSYMVGNFLEFTAS
jgi:hypothetical protein